MTTPTPPLPLAALEDYTDLYGDVPEAATTRVNAALRVASAAVRGAAGYTYLDDDGALLEVPEELRSQTLSTARRLVSNPDRLGSETAGPFSRTMPAAAAAGALLDREERAAVRRAAGRSIVGEIRVKRTPLATLLGVDSADVAVLQGDYYSDLYPT